MIVCDARALPADLATVAVLARLRLVADRLGEPLVVANASARLAELVDLCGLADVLATGLRPLGQPEEREHPLGVEERVDRGDAPA